jgi:hypothetical protein
MAKPGWAGQTGQVRLLLPQLDPVAGLQLGRSRPALSLPADILPLVLADGAGGRRLVTRIGVLSAAGHADEMGHGVKSLLSVRNRSGMGL